MQKALQQKLIRARECGVLDVSNTDLSSAIPDAVIRINEQAFGTQKIWELLPISTAKLSRCNLSSIPSTMLVNYSVELLTLVVDHNDIAELPDSLGECTKLVTLDAGYNKLSRLPDTFLALSCLKQLVLPSNALSEGVFNYILDCAALEVLDLSHNTINIVPDAIACFPRLRVLKLSHCKCASISSRLRECQQLEEMDVTCNMLEVIFTGGSKNQPVSLAKLRLLMASENKLASITSDDDTGTVPKMIFPGLQELYCMRNRMKEMPGWITMCPNLVHVDLSENQLKKLPLSIHMFKSLKVLNLDRYDSFAV